MSNLVYNKNRSEIYRASCTEGDELVYDIFNPDRINLIKYRSQLFIRLLRDEQLALTGWPSVGCQWVLSPRELTKCCTDRQ